MFQFLLNLCLFLFSLLPFKIVHDILFSLRKVLISIQLPKVMLYLHNTIVYYYKPIVVVVIALNLFWLILNKEV